MPVRELTIAFKITMDELVKALGQSHHELNITAMQSAVHHTPARVSHTNGAARITNQRLGMRKLLLASLYDGNGPMPPEEAKALIMGGGYSSKSISNLLWALKSEGLTKRTAKGYAITAKGRAYYESLQNV